MNCIISLPYGIDLFQENAAKVALLQQLDQTIRRLEAVLVQAKDAYDRLSKDLEHIRVAPIHKLPPELLSNIFLIACEGGQHTPTMMKIPLVCHEWRDVLNNTARLWTQIKVQISNDITLSRKQCERAALYTQRSKELDLDVKFDLRSVKPFSDVVEELIDQTYNLPAIPPNTLSRRTVMTVEAMMRYCYSCMWQCFLD
jgi:hypothetical protein